MTQPEQTEEVIDWRTSGRHISPTLAPPEYFEQMQHFARELATAQPGRLVVDGLRIYFERLTMVLAACEHRQSEPDVLPALTKETEYLASLFSQAMQPPEQTN